jgi:hypothetical protein
VVLKRQCKKKVLGGKGKKNHESSANNSGPFYKIRKGAGSFPADDIKDIEGQEYPDVETKRSYVCRSERRNRSMKR